MVRRPGIPKCEETQEKYSSAHFSLNGDGLLLIPANSPKVWIAVEVTKALTGITFGLGHKLLRTTCQLSVNSTHYSKGIPSFMNNVADKNNI